MAGADDGETSMDSKMEDTPANYNLQNQHHLGTQQPQQQ